MGRIKRKTMCQACLTRACLQPRAPSRLVHRHQQQNQSCSNMMVETTMPLDKPMHPPHPRADVQLCILSTSSCFCFCPACTTNAFASPQKTRKKKDGLYSHNTS